MASLRWDLRMVVLWIILPAFAVLLLVGLSWRWFGRNSKEYIEQLSKIEDIQQDAAQV